MRKSWQKFEQLNSITENGSESRTRGSAENDDTRSVSSGVSSQGTWGSTGSRDDTSPSNTLNSSGRKVRSQQRPRSADDDSLFDMLLQGNDEEALEKFETFKREGSIRRSGRKSRRKAELVSSESRERMDSPVGSPMLSRKNSKVDDQTDEKKDAALSAGNGQIPNGGMRRHRSLLDNQQDTIALRAVQRRERQNEYEADATNNNTSTSPIESSNNSGLSVRGLRRSRSESATTSMMSEAMKGVDQEGSDTSYEQSKSRVDSLEATSGSRRDSYTSTSPKTRHRANGRKSSLEQNDSAFESPRLSDASKRDSGCDVTRSSVSDEVTVEEKVTHWQNKLQHVDVEAALDTVETTLVDRERKNREHVSKSIDDTLHESRPRYRRWRTVDGELDTPKAREDRTERRKSQEIYKDHESSVCLDRPINAHLAMQEMTLVQEYRDRITSDRRAIEEIMAVGPLNEMERPRGLKAIQLKRSQSMPPGVKPPIDDNDTWDSIDRQQVEIRRDIIDMKIRATTPERESVKPIGSEDLGNTQDKATEDSSTKPSDSKNTVYQLADNDVYILRENNASNNSENSDISAKASLANRTSASTKSSPASDVNDNTIPLSKGPQEAGSPKPRKSKTVTQPTKSSTGPEVRKPRNLNNLAKPGVAKPASSLSRSTSTPSSLSKSSRSPRPTGSSLLRQSNSVPSNGRSTPTRLNRSVEATKKASRQRTTSGDSGTLDIKLDERNRTESTSSSVSSISSTGTTGSVRTPRTTNSKPRTDSSASNVSRTSAGSERKVRLSASRSSISSVKSTGSTSSLQKSSSSKLKPTTGVAVTQNRSPRSQPFDRNAPARKTVPAKINVSGSISNRGGTSRASLRSLGESDSIKTSPSNSTTSSAKKSSTAANVQRPNSLALNSKSNRTTGKTIREQLKDDAAAKRQLKDNNDLDDTSSMSSLGDTLDKEKTRTRPSQNGASKASPLTRNGSVRKSTKSSSSASSRVSSRNGVGKSSPKLNNTPSPRVQSSRSPASKSVKSTSAAISNGRTRKTPETVSRIQTRRTLSKPAASAEELSVVDINEQAVDKMMTDMKEQNLETSPETQCSSTKIPHFPVPLVRSSSDPDLLKSTMSVSDSNLQREPDIKSSLHRGSTMSLPPDARKRGPPESLRSTRPKPSRLSKFIHRLSRKGEKRPDSIDESLEDLPADAIVEEKPSKRRVQRVPVANKAKVGPAKEESGSRLTSSTASSLRRSKSAAASSKTGQAKNGTQQHGFRPRFGFGSGRFERGTGATRSGSWK